MMSASVGNEVSGTRGSASIAVASSQTGVPAQRAGHGYQPQTLSRSSRVDFIAGQGAVFAAGFKDGDRDH